MVSTQNGERDRPGRRSQCPVANRFSIQRSAGRRSPRARRTRSLQSRIGNQINDGAILKVEGSHRRPVLRDYGGQERLK
jgi:hypothetical protein